MATNTIKRGEFLRDGLNHKPLISPLKTFELGFFSPGVSTHRYLGIWYGNIEDKAVVWVANRANPLSDKSGVLTINNEGNLVLQDGNNITVWSSSSTESSSNNKNRVGAIHDTGNFELSETDTKRVLWESFNHPTDTFLPQMRVRVNSKTGDNLAFVSWRSENDPSPGNYTLGVDPTGAPEIVLWERNKTRKWRSGQWNSAVFTGIPNMSLLTNYLYGFKLSSPPDETGSVYFTYVPSDPTMLLRFKVLYNGTEEELRWNESVKKWTKFQSEPDRNWSRGCRRKTPLKCERNVSVGEDEFLTLKFVKLPDFETPEHNLVVPEDYLVDLQQFEAAGSSLHIRVANSEIEEKKKSKIAVIVGVLVGVILLGIFALLLWRFKRKKDVSGTYCCKNTDTSVVVVDVSKAKETSTPFSGSVDIMIEGKAVNTSELPVFSLSDIVAATDDFCRENELGRGGFGPVYKGVLEDGQEIAVKRLSGKSGQGVDEFKNEIILIAKLQHRNLVRLLGCCFEGEEKMLVYEYMPNKSLDFFIFDEMKQDMVDWKLRFAIIEGIARGLLYLHRDSRLRIIHRDLKVSNVLLDAEMNPKISDFGMARIFGGNQNEANTVRVVGTYGYMSPEYAMEGLFSVKSDVYSFGVLLLEIVSGKRNTSLRSTEHGSLIGYAWFLYTHGRSEELVDPKIRITCNKREALRCIHVAMLCVQDSAAERPNMASVLLMLESDTATLAVPRQPTFTSTRRNSIDVNFALDSSHQYLVSSNEITSTVVLGR
ncbi:hypothetical protein AALP_AA7G038000 [Arabis alpina]|uniref:Receptor-like serine/threonine-protein kinase n=1 Tax=Arabis alpina TaxID=50452 RepID=A0A087GFR6_ARAAL|nr:hypothetical protein AALP_AA7G038000 [Arabis alpina]